MKQLLWGRVDTPFGPIGVGVTDSGLARVALEASSIETAAAGSGQPAAMLDKARRELDEYFAGTRTAFDVPLDWSYHHGESADSAPFRQRVQHALTDINYGEVVTYSQVAEAVGNPGAVRAVGSACATNPLPIIVPCHRVVRSDGKLGNYAGGTDMKRRLLALEGYAAPG